MILNLILLGLNGDLTCRLECSPSNVPLPSCGVPQLECLEGLVVRVRCCSNKSSWSNLPPMGVSQHTILQSYTNIGKVESANINSRMLQIFLSAKPQGYFQIIDGKDLTNYTIPQ